MLPRAKTQYIRLEGTASQCYDLRKLYETYEAKGPVPSDTRYNSLLDNIENVLYANVVHSSTTS